MGINYYIDCYGLEGPHVGKLSFLKEGRLFYQALEDEVIEKLLSVNALFRNEYGECLTSEVMRNQVLDCQRKYHIGEEFS